MSGGSGRANGWRRLLTELGWICQGEARGEQMVGRGLHSYPECIFPFAFLDPPHSSTQEKSLPNSRAEGRSWEVQPQACSLTGSQPWMERMMGEGFPVSLLSLSLGLPSITFCHHPLRESQQLPEAITCYCCCVTNHLSSLFVSNRVLRSLILRTAQGCRRTAMKTAGLFSRASSQSVS